MQFLSLLLQHFRVKINFWFLASHSVQKTHKTSTHQIFSPSDLRLYVQNSLMEEDQLISFTSRLCLADQSSRFPSYFLARGTQITAALTLQQTQHFPDRPAIFHPSRHKANPRTPRSQTGQSLLPRSRFHACILQVNSHVRTTHKRWEVKRQQIGRLHVAADPCCPLPRQGCATSSALD